MHSSFDFTPFSAIKKPWSCTTKWGQIFNEVGFALYINLQYQIVYIILEIKPCGLVSRIRDVEAF